MKTMTVAVNELRKSLERFDAAKTERIGSPSLGDVVRQGDLYLVCVKNMDGKKGVKENNKQLAPGTTQGSRHIAVGEMNYLDQGNYEDFPKVLCGPRFGCKTDVELQHPEHGNKILPKGTTWQVVYQKAFAEEIRRVMD